MGNKMVAVGLANPRRAPDHVPPRFRNCDFAVPDSSIEMADAEKAPAADDPQERGSILWQVEISPDAGQPDRLARSILSDARDLGLPEQLELVACRGFLIQGSLDRSQAVDIAEIGRAHV